MGVEQIPMVRLVRKAGRIEEITVGPSAGTTIVRILIVCVTAGLFTAGVLKWSDITTVIRLPWPW